VQSRISEIFGNSGIDVYFDNVGGSILDYALGDMSQFGRVAICGQISQYNNNPVKSSAVEMYNIPNIVSKDITVQGFLSMSHMNNPSVFLHYLYYQATGKIKHLMDLRRNFDQLPESFVGLFHGTNVGKLVVEKAKRMYIGAMQNTEDRTKSHMVSIIYDERKGDEFCKMEVAITLVPTPTLHDEYMLMRVNGTQNATRVNELFVIQDIESATTLSQIIPMKLNGKMKSVPTNTLFALTKVQSKWGGVEGAEVSRIVKEKPAEYIYMQFGKIRESKLYPAETQEAYTCQFQDPVTMVTAFMIILSRFDAMK